MMPTKKNFGTGLGADSVIIYSPAAWREQVRCQHRVPFAQGPDEVLLHELTHALRATHGIQIHDTVWQNLRMSNNEELCAILVANVYRSARGDQTFLADASDVVPATTLNRDTAFYDTYRFQIDRWFDAQLLFCFSVAAINAEFNPFRAAVVPRTKRRIKSFFN